MSQELPSSHGFQKPTATAPLTLSQFTEGIEALKKSKELGPESKTIVQQMCISVMNPKNAHGFTDASPDKDLFTKFYCRTKSNQPLPEEERKKLLASNAFVALAQEMGLLKEGASDAEKMKFLDELFEKNSTSELTRHFFHEI